jgi:hypothetical protein
MEDLFDMNSEVDVNILINIYNQKISLLTNQNLLLEAKIQSNLKDYEEEKNTLFMANLELQKKYDESNRSKQKNQKDQDKYEEAEI